MQNYMMADIAGTTAAAVIFMLLFLPPGYVLGWASNVLGFRDRSAAEKLLLSLVLSVATVPVVAVLVGRVASLTASLILFVLLALAAGTLVYTEVRRGCGRLHISRTTWIGLGMMVLWALLAVFSLIDLQFGHVMYPTYAIFDHSVRIPFVETAARTGVPPLNPFYGLGKVPVLRYYYYWYVVCALPVRFAGLSGRASFYASVLWCGFALAALIPLYLKHFFRETDALRKKSLIGIFLLLVTGLDLIPYAVMFLSQHLVIGDVEWWDPNQVTSWLGSLIWVPHHVAALIACMAGLLLLSALENQSGSRERAWSAAIAGLAFASAAGVSIFVTFTFAVFAVLWTLILLAQRRIPCFLTYVGAGAVALILSLPYLLDLRSQSAAGQTFAVFAWRDFPYAIEWLRHWGIHNPAVLDFAKLPILVLVYFVEFGFFFIVAVLRCKHELLGEAALTPQCRAAWVMFGTCLLLVSILQSDTKFTAGNDLGFRGMLVIQFVLLLWAAPVVYELFANRLRPAWKPVLLGTLFLGILGTLLQLGLLRGYPVLASTNNVRRTEDFLGVSPGMEKRSYWLRDGFSRLADTTPSGSVLQYNPESRNLWLIHLYSYQQAVAGDIGCGSAFGGDAGTCSRAMPYLVAAFNSPADMRAWDADRFCDWFSINLLIATDTDPVWQERNSWVWTRKALVSNESLRAIPCGKASTNHQDPGDEPATTSEQSGDRAIR